MSEQITRAKSALERVWKPLGQYAYVCGEWTACKFVVNRKEVWMLYRGRETIGKFDTEREAMNAAKEQERKAA